MKITRNLKVNLKEILKKHFKKAFKVHGVDSKNTEKI